MRQRYTPGATAPLNVKPARRNRLTGEIETMFCFSFNLWAPCFPNRNGATGEKYPLPHSICPEISELAVVVYRGKARIFGIGEIPDRHIGDFADFAPGP